MYNSFNKTLLLLKMTVMTTIVNLYMLVGLYDIIPALGSELSLSTRMPTKNATIAFRVTSKYYHDLK